MYLDKDQYFFMKMVVNGKRKIDIYFSRIWSLEREDLNPLGMLKGREQQKKRNGGRGNGIQSSDGRIGLA